MFGRKTKLKWQGEEYELVVTMDGVVEELDEEVNILATAIELDKGGIPKVTTVAKVYSILLNHAGASVTKQEVYESIMADPASSGSLVMAAKHAISLCFPDIESPERPDKTAKKD